MATAYQPPEQAPQDERDYQRRLLESAAPIVGRLSKLADEQVRARGATELRWMGDLELYMGKYDEKITAQLKDEKRSQAFVKLTRHKTHSWSARLGDILFPTDDKNWGISPTPVPKLVEEAKKAVERAKAAVEAANESTDPEQQQRVKEIADSFAEAARTTNDELKEAGQRSDRMEKAIEDQLVEADYVTQCRMVIEDGCKLGTGILKGPMTAQRLRQQWRADGDDWQMVAVPDPLPEFRRVDPWHFFPDMSAARIDEAEFTFERHLPTRRDLKRLAKKLGFNPEAVGRLIAEGPRPTIPAGEVDHLVMLRAVNDEGNPISERYVMWEYHGALECDEICNMLRALGQGEKADRFEKNKDPLADHRVILHFCNNEVLKIAPEYPLDSGESLYSVWNFQRGETSMFGIGVPNMMADSQAALNSAWRMMLDNAALSVGPQLLVNRTVVTPQDGSYSIRPLKVWLLSSTAGVTPNAKPFEVFNIEINQQALGGIIELAKDLEDLTRQEGVHACAYVISKEPLLNHVPLAITKNEKRDVITQFEMGWIEKIGLLKMDFLGLRNLDVIAETEAVQFAALRGGTANHAAPVIRESGIPVGVKLSPLFRRERQRMLTGEILLPQTQIRESRIQIRCHAVSDCGGLLGG